MESSLSGRRVFVSAMLLLLAVCVRRCLVSLRELFFLFEGGGGDVMYHAEVIQNTVSTDGVCSSISSLQLGAVFQEAAFLYSVIIKHGVNLG